jgi:hypothetical protein
MVKSCRKTSDPNRVFNPAEFHLPGDGGSAQGTNFKRCATLLCSKNATHKHLKNEQDEFP